MNGAKSERLSQRNFFRRVGLEEIIAFNRHQNHLSGRGDTHGFLILQGIMKKKVFENILKTGNELNYI